MYSFVSLVLVISIYFYPIVNSGPHGPYGTHVSLDQIDPNRFDSFASDYWSPIRLSGFELDDHESSFATFYVFLNLKDVSIMHSNLMKVSTPGNPGYGKHLSLDDIKTQYSQPLHVVTLVQNYFQALDNGSATVKVAHAGDIIRVRATIGAIQIALQTEILPHLRKDSIAGEVKEQTILRAIKPMQLPSHFIQAISFISLNVPPSSVAFRNRKNFIKPKPMGDGTGPVQSKTAGGGATSTSVLVGISPMICGDGTSNTANPPCNNKAKHQQPTFQVHVQTFTDSLILPEQLEATTIFDLPIDMIFCLDTSTKEACRSDITNASECACQGKVPNIALYTQTNISVYTKRSHESDYQYLRSIGDLTVYTQIATPPSLRDLYGIPLSLTISTDSRSTQAIVEFYNDSFSNTDLTTFQSYFGLKQHTMPSHHVYGDQFELADPNTQTDDFIIFNPNLDMNPNNQGPEATLDMQYLSSIATGAKTYMYSESALGGYGDAGEGFLGYLFNVATQKEPPLVHSVSYGEPLSELQGMSTYGMRCDQQFLVMGLRGISVMIAAGDDGIGSVLIQTEQKKACEKTQPEWPACSPYVTSIGATQLTNKYIPICRSDFSLDGAYPAFSRIDSSSYCQGGIGEAVCSSTTGGLITSGGGFSFTSKRGTSAPWQSVAVDSYLKAYQNINNNPPIDNFDSNGRGYPDVAAYGALAFVWIDGDYGYYAGSSLSTPVFAAMVTYWNDARLKKLMPVLGFLNPLLYKTSESNPQVFQDIIVGNNQCGHGDSISAVPCCKYGFNAAPGWDPVSGLGSVKFMEMMTIVESYRFAFGTESNREESAMTATNLGSRFGSMFLFYLTIAVTMVCVCQFLTIGILLVYVYRRGGVFIYGQHEREIHKDLKNNPSSPSSVEFQHTYSMRGTMCASYGSVPESDTDEVEM